MEIFTVVVLVLTLVAVSVQAFFVARQVNTLSSATQLDHERRMKQATIEYWSRLSDSRHDFRQQLRRRFGDAVPAPGDINKLIASRYQDDPDGHLANALVEYLNGYECFATGINAGVFDLEIADALCGAKIMRTFEQFEAWIRSRRRELGRPHLYAELEVTARAVAARRATGSKVGSTNLLPNH